MKRFNITGTCRPNEHYMVDITERLEIIKKMVAKGDYFCINRGRQYGKTTTLNAIKSTLENENYTVFSLSFEDLGQGLFCSDEKFCAAVLWLMKDAIENGDVCGLSDKSRDLILNSVDDSISPVETVILSSIFSKVCKFNDKPVVLAIDEIDKASDNSSLIVLLSILRKLFLDRQNKATFQSVILAGVYDIKNLKLKIRPEEQHQYNSPWNIAAPFNVDMSLSAEGIKGMLDEYEADHRKGMNTGEVATWIRDYTGGYPFLVSRLCLQMDEQNDWSHEGLLNAVKVILNERNTLFDDMIKQIEKFPDLKSLLRDYLFSGEKKKYNPDNKAFQLAEQFNIICTSHLGTFSIACRIMETRIYEYFMAEENESEIYAAGSIEKTQFIKGTGLDMPLLLQKFSEHFNEIFRTKDGTMDAKFVEKHGRKQFQLYIRPIINGVGHYYVEAETRDETRTDLIINYNNHEYIIELKIWRGDSYNTKGENQLFEYLKLKNQKEGYLVSFCFNKGKTPGLLPSVEQDGSILVEVIV
ncbi:MAG: AAA-like domain-containing protein [Paraprevotella sp.]|nr:AAA-like domain-containing protein [Paraprevotella sp.]